MIFVILVKNAVDYVSKKKKITKPGSLSFVITKLSGKEENSFKKFISNIFFFFFF